MGVSVPALLGHKTKSKSVNRCTKGMTDDTFTKNQNLQSTDNLCILRASRIFPWSWRLYSLKQCSERTARSWSQCFRELLKPTMNERIIPFHFVLFSFFTICMYIHGHTLFTIHNMLVENHNVRWKPTKYDFTCIHICNNRQRFGLNRTEPRNRGLTGLTV